MLKKIRYNIPNAITCMNLIAGTVAIILASKGDEPINGLFAYQWAFILIGVAAVADFLDGFMARLLKAYSEVGKELDSLCDLVSFGVAPAVILYHAIIACGGAEWAAWASLLIPAAGAMRLAKFNVDPRQHSSFIGLPIPANAIFWIGFVSFYYEVGGILNWLTLIAIIGMSWLMLSSIDIYSLKFKNYSFRENSHRYILIVAAVAFTAIGGLMGMAITILYYVLSAVAMNLRAKTKA